MTTILHQVTSSATISKVVSEILVSFDVLAELNVKDKLLFKFKVFRDEAIRDPVFLHMSFVQKTWNKEEAVHVFMRILSKLPYGKSIFYNAKKIIGDPKRGDVIVGVNKVGVHLFGVDQHRHLLNSIEMKDIKRYGSSKTRFILEWRDDDLEFETKLVCTPSGTCLLQ
ncbi:hypothetical protein CTI12_AA089320 [Artemisia annua]|uniref:Uncharacterized protein n=1 Tax=Artemisia annua TaxID=35608 RepID=A0A2U1Q0V5_ARTAN|nr:hypothetical protein CTI12_AA089320 [Artemisia annua]